jgi:uncharacterized protein YndB with AHSA1/START domain
MEKPKFVYVTYIRSTPQKLWSALTKPEFARQYWGGNFNVSDWNKGSKWSHASEDEPGSRYVEGEVLESVPPQRLALSWTDPADSTDTSRVTFDIEQVKEMTRLTVIHTDFKPGSTMAGKVSFGWPLVLSSLKSWLETGSGIDIWALKMPSTVAAA